MMVSIHLTCQVEIIFACMLVYYGLYLTFLLMEVCPAGAKRGIRHVLLVIKTHHHKASEAKYVIWAIGDSYLLITIGEGVDNMMVSLNINHHQRYYLVMTFWSSCLMFVIVDLVSISIIQTGKENEGLKN